MKKKNRGFVVLSQKIHQDLDVQIKSINIKGNSKRRNSLKLIRNIIKNKYKKKFFKRNIFKRKSKTNVVKKCKCWLCNQEGHYANKCPKKMMGLP